MKPITRSRNIPAAADCPLSEPDPHPRGDAVRRLLRNGMAALAVATLFGCAQVKSPVPSDPWESFNRGVYAFNDVFDHVVLKPVALGYEAIVPSPARTCINNIFGNVGDVWSGVNSMLQGRGRDFVDTFGRILFNSTMGLGGCIDVASMNGAHKIPNDFGMTLGVWGFGSGPYLMLPFAGPSTVRDGAGLGVSLLAPLSTTSAIFHIENIPVRNSTLGLFFVDTRAALLEDERLLDQIALDKYSFIRDAYLQRRKAMLDSRRRSERASTQHALDQETSVGDQGLPVYDDSSLPVYDDPEDDQ